MTQKPTLAAIVVGLVCTSGAASAQEEINATPAGESQPPAQSEVAAAAGEPETIEAIVRGLYVEARVGGGYMVATAKLADISDELPQQYPQAGSNEDLGGGTLVHLAAGFDIADMIAVQAVGGATLVGGGGAGGLVRDLSMVFGGAGLRLAFQLDPRLHLLAEANVAYVNASNSVESDKSGVAAVGGVGLEYYVHVRHFSIGVDLTVFAPFSPFRMFVGLAPTVKYTF
jgi:hypothetical protein